MSDKTETKNEAFRRLAAARTEAIIDQARKIANLSSGNYEYSPAEIDHMFTAIEAAFTNAKARFCGKKEKTKFTFN